MHCLRGSTILAFLAATLWLGIIQESLQGAEALWNLPVPDIAPTSTVVTSTEPDAMVLDAGETDGGHCSSGCPTASGADRWWFAADYLLLWTNGNPVPPLVSTNSSVPPRNQAGVLGVGDTEVLVGGQLDEGGRSGVAMSGGYWLDQTHCWGLQATWWYTGDPSNELDDTWVSPGEPVYTRPFFNAASGLEDSQLVAYPDVVAGAVRVATASDLRSVETLLSMNWLKGCQGRVDLLGGYRYLRFREGVFVEENLVSTNPGGQVQIGTTIDVFDQFNTGNSFHGGTVGLLTSFERGNLQLDIATKLGIGNVRRQLRIDGGTVITAPNGSQASSAGGLLALSSNIGRYEDDAFGLLPELDLNARVYLTDRLSVNAGYNLLFLTNIYRVGSQIDRTVDPGLLPDALSVNSTSPDNLTRPTLLLDSSTLCVQGLNVGFTLTY